MKRFLVAIAALAVAAPALAQSSKYSIQLGQATLVGYPLTSTATDPAWTPILATQIKTSSQADLILGASLETGLFTDTMVSSMKGTKDTSSAEATVKVRIKVDGVVAQPGEVTFDRRAQTLIAEFGGVLQQCTVNASGSITLDDCTFTPETLELILDTMGSHAFFFAMPNVGVGLHDVVVEARTDTTSSAQTGTAAAKAWVGKGSIMVEEVGLIKAASGQLIDPIIFK